MTRCARKPTTREKQPKMETDNRKGNHTKLTGPEALDRARMSEVADATQESSHTSAPQCENTTNTEIHAKEEPLNEIKRNEDAPAQRSQALRHTAGRNLSVNAILT